MSLTKEAKSSSSFHPSIFELPLNSVEKPKGRIKNVVFDWYGTLYDCAHMFPGVFSEEVHKRFGVPKEEARRNFELNAGLPISKQIEDLLGTERFGKFDKTTIEAAKSALYNRLDELDADIFDDASGALYSLLRNGYTLSVLSHNKEQSLITQLEKKGLKGFFKFAVGRDSCEECGDKGEGFVYLSELYDEPHWKFIDQTAFVTDTTLDATRGALSGLTVIARTGYYYPTRQPLYNARANWVVSNFRNLHSIVSTM